MKQPTTIHRPILLLPYSGACTFGDQGAESNHANVTTAPVPHSHQTYDSRNVASLAQWILYATQTPKRVKNLMMHPYAQTSLDAFRKGGLKKVPQQPLMFDLGSGQDNPVSLNGKPLNLTGLEPDALYPLLYQRDLHDESILRISFKPDADLYRVQLFPRSAQHPAKGDPQIAAAWANTRLSDNTTVATLITDHSQRVVDGARELILMGRSALDHPQVVTVQEREVDGEKKIDFWVVEEDSPEPKGSAVALQVGSARERLKVGDLIEKFIAASTNARRDGKIPTAAFDLDGTLFNARLYVWDLFVKWLEGYQPRTEDAAKILEPIRTDVAARTERDDPIMAWNTKKLIAKHYGVTDEGIIEDIHAHFKEHFYNPKRSLDVPPIPGMIVLANILIWLGFRTVFPTHRSVEDDQLPDGRSATIEALRPLGIWENGKSKLLRHEGPKINWEVTTVGEEPKSAMVIPLLRNNPWLWAGTFYDNDTTHIGSYRILKGGICVHVEGDVPLGKEGDPVPNNVHSIRDIDALAEEIESWIEGEKPHLERRLSAQGTRLADKFMSAASRLAAWTSNDHGRTDRSILGLNTEDSAKVLFEVLSYPRENPLYVSFMSQLSKHLSLDPEMLDAFPSILEIVNTHNRYTGDPSTFSAEIQAGTLVDIKRHVGGDPFDSIDEPAQRVDVPRTGMKISKRSIADVENSIGTRENDLDLFAIPSADRYDALLNEQFERMNSTLSSLTGAYAAMTGKPTEQIRVTEYEPRLSVSALMAFTRLGVDTGWHSDNKRFRIHTQRQLDRLPEEIRSNISFRVQDKDLKDIPPDSIIRHADIRASGQPSGVGDDIALWNLPRRDLTIAQMGARVFEGGLVVTQSPTDYREQPDLRADTTGFTNIMSLVVSAGDYVLPSAFMPKPALATTLFFQIWQRTEV